MGNQNSHSLPSFKSVLYLPFLECKHGFLFVLRCTAFELTKQKLNTLYHFQQGMPREGLILHCRMTSGQQRCYKSHPYTFFPMTSTFRIFKSWTTIKVAQRRKYCSDQYLSERSFCLCIGALRPYASSFHLR